MCDIWEKWGYLGGEIKDSKNRMKFCNSEMWGKGVCDMWEKWACLGGEIQDSKKTE